MEEQTKQTSGGTTSTGEKPFGGAGYHEATDSPSIEIEKQTKTDERPEYHGFATDIQHVPKGYFTSKYFIGTYVAHCFTFLGGLGGFNLIAPILGDIDVDIGPSANILWVAIVYTLGLAVGPGLMGRITDVFGRRWFMVGGNFLGTIGAIICSRAQSVNVLIGGGALIGCSACAAYSFNFVISEIVPMQYRFYALAGLFVVTLPMNGFNTIIATSFVVNTEAGWRWCYYLLIILNGMATLLYFVFYHPPTFQMKHQNVSKTKVLKEFDYVGALGLMTGVTLFLIGLNWGGNLYAWKNAHVIGTMVVGAALIILLPFYEAYANVKDPFIPFLYYSFSIIWPSMVQIVYADGNQIWGGWASTLVAMGFAVGQIMGGALTMTVTKQKYQCIVAMTFGIVFLGATATCTADSKAKAQALVFLSCLFVGWNEAVVSTVVTVCISDQRDIGAAAGISGCIRSLFGSVSAAIYSAILRSRLSTTIPALVPAAVTAAGLTTGSVMSFLEAFTVGTPAAFAAVKGITPKILAAGTRAYQVANVDAYRTVFLATIAFGGLGIILGVFVPNVDELLTSDIAVTLHGTGDKDAVSTVGDKPLHVEHHEHHLKG